MVSWRHWNGGRDVAHAEALQIDGTTMLLDQDDSPRQLARGNLVIEEFGDALELVRRGGDIGGARPTENGRSEQRGGERNALKKRNELCMC
jgi:hypothetical protein